MAVADKIYDFFSLNKPLHYRKKEVVIRAQDVPQGVFYIKRGYVRLYTLLPDGHEMTFNIFKPGYYFPMIWALGELPNAYFYETLTPAELLRASKKDTISFIKKNSDVLYELTCRAFRGTASLLTNIEYLYSGNATKRTIFALLLCARRFGNCNHKKNICIDIPFTHQDIANLSGITRETASIEIKKLERQNFLIRQKRLFVIRDIEKLQNELSLNK